MPYLRKRDTGAVTEQLSSDSLEYQTLKAMRFQTDVTAQLTAGQSGIISGETGGTIKAGSPVWEEVAEEDAGFPDPPGGRVIVLRIGSAATAGSETSSDATNPPVSGTLTDVEYVSDPNGAGITGQATNNRQIVLQQVVFTGAASPTRTVTALATVGFGAGVNASPGVPVAMTINNTGLTSDAQLQAVSTPVGTGLPDPGGLVYAVYTRA